MEQTQLNKSYTSSLPVTKQELWSVQEVAEMQ